MNQNIKRRRGLIFYLLVMIALVGLWYFIAPRTSQTYTQSQLDSALSSQQVRTIVIHQNRQVPTGSADIEINNGQIYRLTTNDVGTLVEQLKSTGFSNYVLRDVPSTDWLSALVPSAVVGVILITFFMLLMNAQNRAQSDSNNQMLRFGKSRAKKASEEDAKLRFSDVAGLDEEKEDLQELVEFLSNPEQFTRVGARIPKGVILVGPPGTGKTLLAKAVAGEAGVPFFSLSGSDFVEMFVGVGASRVRDLFAEAKKNAPCIIFIDEIDAVARRRGTGMGGGHDEREQTLNQMLVEMDGFGVNEGIIVMAATNRVDILDPAIMRPGRFDRTVYVGRPDIKGREEILRVHTRKKPLAEDVDLHQVAQISAGFTGADLENLMNEAAIAAAKDKRAYILMKDIRNSFVKVGIGAEKKSRIISEKEKRITAYHEAGHAILLHVLPDVGPVASISIIPTGGSAAGYTMPLAERDDMFATKGKMFQDIVVDFGGRVAEELIFDDVTTGASSDIKQASQEARAMVTKYGFSAQVGPIAYGDDEEQVFIGRDLAHTKSYSDSTQSVIDAEVQKIITRAYDKAKELLTEHMSILHTCAALLLEKEKLHREEFEALFAEEKIDSESSEELLGAK